MTWETLSPAFRELALEVLTRRQLDVFRLRAGGASWRTVSWTLGISPTMAKDHLDAAGRNLLKAGASIDQHGHWHYDRKETPA